MKNSVLHICTNSVESIDHLVISHELAIDLWRKVFKWMYISYHNWKTKEEIYEWVGSNPGPTRRKEVFEAIVFVTLGFIWRFDMN